jgi:hypothetical protein
LVDPKLAADLGERARQVSKATYIARTVEHPSDNRGPDRSASRRTAGEVLEVKLPIG